MNQTEDKDIDSIPAADEPVTENNEAAPAAEPVTELPAEKENTSVKIDDEQARGVILETLSPARSSPIEEKPQCVRSEAPYFTEGKIDNGPVVAMPSSYDSVLAERFKTAPNVTVDESKGSLEWLEAIQGGASFTTVGDTFRDALEDPNNEFTNRLVDGKSPLFSGFPPSAQRDGRELRGEAAVSRIYSAIGAGRSFQTALYKTGIYLTFKPASESARLELNRLLLSDEIRIGRMSYGLVMSSITGVSAQRICEMALEHVYDTSVVRNDIPLDQLAKNIKLQDMNSLMWGFLNSCYPDGFNFERACTASVGKCDNVQKAILNLSKLQYPRTKAFKPETLTHMTRRRAGAMNMDQIKSYQANLLLDIKNSFEVTPATGDTIRFHFRDPVLTDYFDNTNEWLSNIESMALEALGQESTPEARNGFVSQHAKASAMRQYGHWVDRIEVFNELDPEKIDLIEDRDTIGKTLAAMSSNKDIRTEFLKNVKRYINESTMAIIGIPVYDCPNCGKENKSEEPVHDEFTNLIALDVMQVFFELLSQMKRDVNTR